MPSVCLINYLKFTTGHVRVCRCGGGLPQYLISQTCGGILGPQASLLGPGVGNLQHNSSGTVLMYDFSPVLPADSPGSHAGLYRTASDSKMVAKVSRAAHKS